MSKVTKLESFKIVDGRNVYRINAKDAAKKLFSETQIAQIATWRGKETFVPINGRLVECKRISVYKDKSTVFRSALPRTTPHYVVIRLDNGKRINPAADMFLADDPYAGR
jgi:hypothetical protein